MPPVDLTVNAFHGRSGRSSTLSHYSPIAREDTYLSQGRPRCGRDGRPAFWPAPQSAVKGHRAIRARVAVVGASSLASQSINLSRFATLSLVPRIRRRVTVGDGLWGVTITGVSIEHGIPVFQRLLSVSAYATERWHVFALAELPTSRWRG
jgi:hypothetical protein